MISQRCQYALRAVFELACRQGQGPVRIADIAAAQGIPPRFLEAILGQLKQSGLVASRRGAEGGYVLAKSPEAISMGEVIRFVDGPIAPVKCVQDGEHSECLLGDDCVFMNVWKSVQRTTSEIYDRTTMADLVEEQRARTRRFAVDFTI